MNGVEQPKFDALTMGEFSLTIHYYTHLNKLLILYMRFTLVEGPPCNIRNKMYTYIIYIDHGLFSSSVFVIGVSFSDNILTFAWGKVSFPSSKGMPLAGSTPIPQCQLVFHHWNIASLHVCAYSPENLKPPLIHQQRLQTMALHMCVDE